MKWLRNWLQGSDPDLNRLLTREDAVITVERANGDRIEITPLAAARQRQNNNGNQKPNHRDNGNGRPNSHQTHDNNTQNLFRR